MEALMQRKPQFIGIAVEERPRSRVNNWDESILSSFSAYLEYLTLYRFPCRVNQLRFPQHSPQQEPHQRAISIGSIAAKAHKRNGIKNHLKFSRTKCLG